LLCSRLLTQEKIFKKICGFNSFKKPKTIAEWVGLRNVEEFIKMNKLDPKTTNGQTIIPEGYLVSLRKKPH
jgi:hypothetical protein